MNVCTGHTVLLESYTPNNHMHMSARVYTCKYLVIGANISERANYSCERDCLYSEMAWR